MSTATLEVVVTAGPRSPSPIVPGAWPSSPFHQRSNTFPVVSSQGVLPANTLHLDHVRHFQQSLSRTLFKSSNVASRSAENLCLSDAASTPSDGSGLTRFTLPDNNVSTSMFGDTTIDTSCSSPTNGTVGSSVDHRAKMGPKDASISNESRIYDAASDSMSKIFPSTSNNEYRVFRTASLPLSTQVANRPQSSTAFPASLSGSSWSSRPSVSPISFSSPTSSNNILPSRVSYQGQGYCPSLELSSSPSWETSFGSHIGGFDSSRAESDLLFTRPARMLNPSQSQPLNTFDARDNNESSPELDISSIPMLTTLSLPGSLDTSLNISHRSSFRHGRRTRTVSPLDPNISHTQNSSRSLSSSPHVSDVTGSAVLEFPSPPLSLSPFITAPPPDSPIIHLNSSAADSSTIEYASAVVSSAWGGDLSVHPDYTVGHIVSRVSASPGHELPQPTVLEYTGRTKASIMTKIKTFGKKMKKLVSVPQYNAKPERSHLPDKDPSEDVATFVQPLTLVIDTPDAPTEAGLPGEDSFVSVEQGNCLLPLPPGLSSSSSQRQLRGVSLETYTSGSVSPRHRRSLTGLPLVGITSSSCSYRTPVAVSDDITGSRPSEGNTSTLEIEARPKTLAEIKSKRRLSLSILPGSNRSVSQPNSSIIAVARTRSRPRSAIILPVASSSSIGDEDVVSVHVGRSPNAPTPAEAHERPVPVTTSTPNAHSTVRQGTDNQRNGTANKKKHRRFSLSALSHLVKST